MGQFVHKGFHDERIDVVAGAAIGAGHEVERQDVLFDLHGGDALARHIGGIGKHVYALPASRVTNHHCCRIAILAQACLELGPDHRPEAALAHGFFARPHHMDRLAGIFLGDRHHHAGIVAEDATAETATHKGLVHIDVFGRKAGFLGSDHMALLGMLGRHPDIGPLVGDESRAVQRFHVHVIGVAGEIISFHDTIGIGDDFAGITFRNGDIAFVLDGVHDGLANLGIVGPLYAVAQIPFDGESFECGLGLPIMLGDDRHRRLGRRGADRERRRRGQGLARLIGIDDHDIEHAGHAHDRLTIDIGQTAALHRHLPERGIDLAGELDVDTENRLPVDEHGILQLGAGNLAQRRPFGTWLERYFAVEFDGCRRFRDFAIGERFIASRA